MAVAQFDYALWAARYPELADTVSPALANAYFMEAGLRLDNSDCSIVTDATQRLVLLNMIVAHIASLNGAGGDGSPAGIVGPIKSATEGSTSVTTGLGELSIEDAYWASTPYGLAYLNIMAPLATAHYVPAPPTYTGVPMYGAGRWTPIWGSPAWPR